MSPEALRQVEQFVRPLYAGLDGVQTFDRVERLRARAGQIQGGEPVDEELLELLLLLHGAADRLGTLAAGGRLDLFLRGLGIPEERVRRVRAALGRWREDPRGPEESLLHDALLAEEAGVLAAAERLMAAGKKRVPLARALAQLDPGPAPERYRTRRGAALGAERRREAEEWIAALRRRAQEEGLS
jgi:hypothetical protein